MQVNFRLLFVFFLFLSVRAQEDDETNEDSGDDGLEQDTLNVEQLRAMHSKFDGNSDGKASMAEVLTYAGKMRLAIAKKDVHTILEEMDKDHNGKLSLQELLKDMDQQTGGSDEDAKLIQDRKDIEAQKFKVADSNGDGNLDADELPALFYPETHQGVLELVAKRTFDQKDTNKDGLLTSKEFWEGDSVDGEEIAISDEENADFEKLDKDRSGKLDLAELTEWESGKFHTEEALKKLFDVADKDGDMHITATEFENAREQIAETDAHYHLMEWADHHDHEL